MTLESKLRALVAECDALRKERYNTTNWDPKAMQLLFYCAEAMREALLAERQPATDEVCFTCEGEKGLPATHSVKICADCAGEGVDGDE